METPVTSHGEVIDKPEFDFITSLAQELAAWFTDFYAGQNVVQPGGGALGAQAGTPIVVTYAGFTALVNGPARMARYVVSSGTVTLAAADATNPRYDLIVGTASQTTGTDTGGQPTNKDVLTVTKVTGTPATPPTIPSLPVNSVQLGYVLVPANATSAQTCTITSSLAPLAPKNLQDLTNHIAASILTTAVHGIQATLPAGTGTNQIAQTGPRGGVGALEGNWWFPGSGQTPTTDGVISPRSNGSGATDGAFLEYFPPTTGSNTAAKLNIAGPVSALALLKLWASTVEVTGGLQIDGPVNALGGLQIDGTVNALGGLQIDGTVNALGGISALWLNATTITESGAPVPSEDAQGRVPYAVKADSLTHAGVPNYVDRGGVNVSITSADGYKHYPVSFTAPFTVAPSITLTAQVTADPTGGVSYYVLSPTSTGFTLDVVTGTSWSGVINWNAVGS